MEYYKYGLLEVLALACFGPPSRALVDYQLEKGGIPLHDAVG